MLWEDNMAKQETVVHPLFLTNGTTPTTIHRYMRMVLKSLGYDPNHITIAHNGGYDCKLLYSASCGVKFDEQCRTILRYLTFRCRINGNY